MGEIEQKEQQRAEDGNTDKSSAQLKKQGVQHSYYCFTFNNYTETDLEILETTLTVEGEWFVFQEEEGTEETPHLQGTIKFKKRKRLTELKKQFSIKIHWEPTNKVPASIEYCCDHKKRKPNGRLFHKDITLPDIAEPLEVDEPYGWQLSIMEILSKKPDKRIINWLWEPNGNVGKSTFCKYLVVKHNAIMLTGKSQDMFNALKQCKSKRLIIVDTPRSQQDFINYGALEQIKNGLVFSGKYESCQLVFNTPHLIVFSNEPPDYEKMSQDRWNVIDIRTIM